MANRTESRLAEVESWEAFVVLFDEIRACDTSALGDAFTQTIARLAARPHGVTDLERAVQRAPSLRRTVLGHLKSDAVTQDDADKILVNLRDTCPADSKVAAGLCTEIRAAMIGREPFRGAEHGELATTVSQLYARYAWIAVFSNSSPPGAEPLAHASHRELMDVFVPDLAEALWADAQCAARRREICALDFDILFGSQDPSATDLTVEQVREDEVQVCFNETPGSRKCLTVRGARVHGAFRILDIAYPGQQSLRQLLRLPQR